MSDNKEIWFWRILFVLMTLGFVWSQVELQERQNLLNDAQWELRVCVCSNEVCLANNENYRNRLAKRMYEDYKQWLSNMTATDPMRMIVDSHMIVDSTGENQTGWEIRYKEE